MVTVKLYDIALELSIFGQMADELLFKYKLYSVSLSSWHLTKAFSSFAWQNNLLFVFPLSSMLAFVFIRYKLYGVEWLNGLGQWNTQHGYGVSTSRSCSFSFFCRRRRVLLLHCLNLGNCRPFSTIRCSWKLLSVSKVVCTWNCLLLYGLKSWPLVNWKSDVNKLQIIRNAIGNCGSFSFVSLPPSRFSM